MSNTKNSIIYSTYSSFKTSYLHYLHTNRINKITMTDVFLYCEDNFPELIDNLNDFVSDLIETFKENNIILLDKTCNYYFVPKYINSLCTSEKTIERAFELVNSTRTIFDLYNDEDGLFGNVYANSNYHIHLIIKNGKLIEHYCECEAHKRFPGICKHIVAAMYELKSQNGSFTNRFNGQIPDDITVVDGNCQYSEDDFIELSNSIINKIIESNRIRFDIGKVSYNLLSNDCSVGILEIEKLIKRYAVKISGDPFLFSGKNIEKLISITIASLSTRLPNIKINR